MYPKPLYFIRTDETPGNVSGLWIDTNDFGAVICLGAGEGRTNDHVILRELAHILLDNRTCSREPHSEELVERVAFAVARLLHSEQASDEEAHFG